MPGLVPLIPIQLDKERHLRLDLNAIIEIERETGDTIDDAFNIFLPVPKLAEDATPKQRAEAAKAIKERRLKLFPYCRLFLWAMMLHEDPKLTLAQVGGMIDMNSLINLRSAVVSAINAGMPEAEVTDAADSGEPKNDESRSTGPDSGPSGGTT
jgi:hypothetical protein